MLFYSQNNFALSYLYYLNVIDTWGVLKIRCIAKMVSFKSKLLFKTSIRKLSNLEFLSHGKLRFIIPLCIATCVCVYGTTFLKYIFLIENSL